mmetsp:Transcript_74493/g.218367  ORF Transcript_74493/g.218367 Transcript_74493/m.218367 type:complete len:617 (-) Transcript_74493:402-2252(-)
MAQVWEIVGGADKGGILVKEAEALSSAPKAERLSTGALVEELELRQGRLHFKKLAGAGPAEGWISIAIPGKDLAVRTDKRPASTEEEAGAWAPPAGQEELPPEQPVVLGPSGVPRKLLPACEVAARMPALAERLGPMKKSPNGGVKEKQKYWERCCQRLTGELFGLPFAQTPEEFVLSPAFGAEWLTQAFRRAGTLAEDNRVERITWWRRFPGGGSGPKTLFVVEYEKPDEELDTTLFMKQPHPLEENKEQRFREEGMYMFGDVPGGEINFYRFVSPYVPFPVPKFYFADLNRESSESCVINNAVDWPKKGKAEFGPYEILPPCEKCEDWRLKDSHEYYFAMMKRMGALAGLEKVGKLGPELSTVEWSPYGPSVPKKDPGMAAFFVKFVEEVAPQIWPEKVRSKAFLGQFQKHMDAVATVAHIIGFQAYADPLFIGFGHANGNSDNAYFYRNADGVMECGFYDWGQTGFQAFTTMFEAGLGSCLGEMLAEYDDRLMQCFADAYHETGAPPFDVPELIERFRLSSAVYTEAMCGRVLPWLSEKHPQGKPFWKSVKAWNDEKIIADFGLKFGVSMFYNAIVRWSLRADDYWASVKRFVKRPEVAKIMSDHGISQDAFA